ncbi:MAG: hypothetical protein AAF828_00195 [Bacteroidota bacterium]
MRNIVHRIEHKTYKSIALTDDALLLSSSKPDTLEELKANIEKGGLLTSTLNIPVQSIKAVSQNSSGSQIKFSYTNENGKVKKQTFGIGLPTEAAAFAAQLGELAGLSSTTDTENPMGPLLTNAFLVLLAGGGTAFIALTDFDEVDVSGRNRGRAGILKLIKNTLGETGVWIVGGLLTAYLIYSLYQRFSNPANETKWG